jgi:hypothetical protein
MGIVFFAFQFFVGFCFGFIKISVFFCHILAFYKKLLNFSHKKALCASAQRAFMINTSFLFQTVYF